MMMEMYRSGEWLVGKLRETEDGLPFGELLRNRWRLPRKTVHLLFQHGGVLADGNAVRPHHTARAGQELRLWVCMPEPYGIEPTALPLEVLYEDDHLLVVNKPAGMMLHPTEPHHNKTLDHAVAGYLQQTGVQTKVRHVHRLDQDTSGVVLYAKHGLASALLDEALALRKIGRTYVAYVMGRVKADSGTIDKPIGRDRHHPVRRRVSANGERAVTHYRVLARYGQASKVECQLETGRTHQIRVHFQSLGHPLLGDRLYGGNTDRIHRQALHAALLSLEHPFGGRKLEIAAPLPEELVRLESGLSRSRPALPARDK